MTADDRVGGYRGGKPASEMGPPAKLPSGSVDALRTRLARAFEVAALRDPSADLAAFEAAVRREATDTVAVDHEALAEWLRSIHFDGSGCGTNGTGGCSNCYGPSPMDAYELAEALVESGPLLDAVVHVHHHDIEKHAESYNEGYEEAVTQGLADDPTKADEWLASHSSTVRHEHGERIAKAQEAEARRYVNYHDGLMRGARLARDLSPAPEAKP